MPSGFGGLSRVKFLIFLSHKCFFVELLDTGEALVVVEGLLGDLPNGLVGVEGDVRRDDDIMHGGQILK